MSKQKLTWSSLLLSCRCAVPDFGYAYQLEGTYNNVSYLLAPGEEQFCSGYLAPDLTWTVGSLTSSSGSNGGSGGNGSSRDWTFSGGKPGQGYTCPVTTTRDSPWGQVCAAFENPNSGMTSFDNILWAWVAIFQCITQEGWTDIMYAMQDAVSPWVWIYFVALILFGSFFIVNLALAVLYLQFMKGGLEGSPSTATTAATSYRGSFTSSPKRSNPASGRSSSIEANKAKLEGTTTIPDGDAGGFIAAGWVSPSAPAAGGWEAGDADETAMVTAQISIAAPASHRPAAADGLPPGGLYCKVSWQGGTSLQPVPPCHACYVVLSKFGPLHHQFSPPHNVDFICIPSDLVCSPLTTCCYFKHRQALALRNT